MAPRLSYALLFALLLVSIVAVGGEPAKPETPFNNAKRLALSEKVKDRTSGLQILRRLKGIGHIDKERALRLYGLTALSLRKEWRDGIKEAGAAFAELATKGRFKPMRWRGEIGKWKVRLALAADSLAKGSQEGEKAEAELDALDVEIGKVLARQNDQEHGIDIAFLLGRVRETAGHLPAALKAYKHCLRLYENHKKRRKHYSAAVEDYWGLLDAARIKRGISRLNKMLNAKREPLLSFEKARRLQGRKKYKAAMELFDKVAKDYPEHLLGSASGYYGAECSHALRQYAGCRQRLQAFIESSPQGYYRGHAHLLLGDLLTLMAFDLDRGAREYEAVLNPTSWRLWWPATTQAKAKPKSASPDETWKAVRHKAHDRLGVIAYFDRKYARAEKHFAESARLKPPRESYPGGVPVGMELVVEKVRKKKLPYRVTQDVLRGDRRVGFALFWAAVVAEGWRYGEAMAVCDRLRTHLSKAMTEDQKAFLCVRRGELFGHLNKPKEAAACYAEFSSEKGKYLKSRWGAEGCLLHASMLYSRGEDEKGERYLKLAFTRYANCRWADWAMYQWALMKADDEKTPPKAALGYLQQALSRYPKSEYAKLARMVAGDLREDMRKKR